MAAGGRSTLNMLAFALACLLAAQVAHAQHHNPAETQLHVQVQRTRPHLFHSTAATGHSNDSLPIARQARAIRSVPWRQPASGWMVLWADHFDGHRLNPKKWGLQLYDGCQYGLCGWGNGEQAWYTNASNNVRVTRGKLVIEAQEVKGAERRALQQACWDECGARCARRMRDSGPDIKDCIISCGQSRCPGVRFTSARIRTRGRFSVSPSAHKTIRIEARMSMPRNSRLWPALWMLPEQGGKDGCSGCGVYGGWAASGEIDIAETTGGGSRVHGSLHYGGPWPNQASCTGSRSLAPGFHTFAIEWEADEMRWYLDRQQYHHASRRGVSPTGWWSAGRSAKSSSPFDVPFHLIINLAVGGRFQGSPTPAAVSQALGPQAQRKLVVDYIRVLGR